MAAQSISFDLIDRVREFYTMAAQEIASDKRKQVLPDNGVTDYAIPSYILSVAAVEAFTNEVFLAVGLNHLQGSSFARLSEAERQQFVRVGLRHKLIELPYLAFDQVVFVRGQSPFEDMHHLINVRNSFVHYKMGYEAEYKEAFDYLISKGIALNSPDGPSRFWTSDLSTFAGIRWAHNTALKIITDIIDTAIKTNRHQLLILMGTQTKDYFNQIPDPLTDRELWQEWLTYYRDWVKVEKPRWQSV